MSIKFETLYHDNRVQAFFKGLCVNKDFSACQALMSPALFKLSNATADFTNQKAFLKEQPLKISLIDESLVSGVEEKCKEFAIVKANLGGKVELRVKAADLENFKKVFTDNTKYKIEE